MGVVVEIDIGISRLDLFASKFEKLTICHSRNGYIIRIQSTSSNYMY